MNRLTSFPPIVSGKYASPYAGSSGSKSGSSISPQKFFDTSIGRGSITLFSSSSAALSRHPYGAQETWT